MTPRATRLIETVRVCGGHAPLWPLHLARLRSSAAALDLRLGRIEAPTGDDRVVRIVAGNGGVSIEERPVAPPERLRVAFAGIPHPGYPHKTEAREAFARALDEVRIDGAAEALLSTTEGWVAEGSYTAVFWWEDAALMAPPLGLDILPSVARHRIAGLAGTIHEKRIDPRGLMGHSVFLANAARGVVEVASLQGEIVRRDERTAALASRFWT
jgi:para-aminobenzoate synthetase/4-amino-4-deoxychorismate lyase